MHTLHPGVINIPPHSLHMTPLSPALPEPKWDHSQCSLGQQAFPPVATKSLMEKSMRTAFPKAGENVGLLINHLPFSSSSRFPHCLPAPLLVFPFQTAAAQFPLVDRQAAARQWGAVPPEHAQHQGPAWPINKLFAAPHPIKWMVLTGLPSPPPPPKACTSPTLRSHLSYLGQQREKAAGPRGVPPPRRGTPDV